jgi:hypothetical protein
LTPSKERGRHRRGISDWQSSIYNRKSSIV